MTYRVITDVKEAEQWFLENVGDTLSSKYEIPYVRVDEGYTGYTYITLRETRTPTK